MEALSPLEQIKRSPELPKILAEITEFWKKESEKRNEFYALIHEDTKVEFINGEIIFHSPVKGKHWVACTNIGAYLTVYVNQHKLGRVGIEKVMIRCTRNDYEPDVVFFNQAKADEFMPDQLLFPPPDLAVEVLSDSTQANDYGVKFQDYALHKVMEYWIVNTDEQAIEQYILKEGAYYLHQKIAKQGKIQSFAVERFEMEISQIFG